MYMKGNKKYYYFLYFCLFSLIFYPTSLLAAPLKIVSSFTILSDMIHEIGQNEVDITTLVGVNSDSHIYQATPQDLKKIEQADAIFINGLGFEPWFIKLQAVSKKKTPVIIATEGLIPLALNNTNDHHHHQASIDPHAWQNVANSHLYIQNIVRGLSLLSPDKKSFFLNNAQRYEVQLNNLDQWIKQELSQIPNEKKYIITNHNSFGYFEQAYGLKFIAPLGINMEAEPTPKAISSLIKLMKETKTYSVFIENMSDPRFIQQIAEDGGGIIEGKLYSDTLSEETGPANSYVKMMRYNVQTIIMSLKKNMPS